MDDTSRTFFLSTDTFTVATDRRSEFVTGVRVRADCGTDGTFTGTVTTSSYASGTDLTTVTLSPDAGELTANLTGVLHGNNDPNALANHGHTGPADGGKLIQCRAWVNFNGTTAMIRASENISSVVNNGSGKYTINFLNAMPDENYAIVGTGIRHQGVSLGQFYIDGDTSGKPTNYTRTSFSITLRNNNDSATDASFTCVAVFR